MKRKLLLVSLLALALSSQLLMSCLVPHQVVQYGVEGKKTIALNLTPDPNLGTVYVTHVNGVATGANFTPSFFGIGGSSVVVNPLYIELTGKPIIFNIICPLREKDMTVFRKTELRLTKLSDIKPGDVLTLRWMHQTQTFAFLDATGNIIQQTIPTFN